MTAQSRHAAAGTASSSSGEFAFDARAAIVRARSRTMAGGHDAGARMDDVEAMNLAGALQLGVVKRELDNEEELLLAASAFDASAFAPLSHPKPASSPSIKRLKKTSDALEMPYFLPPSHSPATPASSLGVTDDGRPDDAHVMPAATPTSPSTTPDTAACKLLDDVAISRIISTMTLRLNPGTFVFICLSSSSCLPPVTELQMLFREAEGVTLLVSLDFATAQKMRYFSPCRSIAVDVDTAGRRTVPGLMATLASVLAVHNLGLNSVSAFYHDHLLVPVGREDEAIEVLRQLAADKQQEVEGS